MAEAALVRE